MVRAFKAFPYSGLVLTAAILLAINAILNGLSFPNRWSYTHFLFSCTDVFVKRSLVGCAVEKLSNNYFYSYEFFALLSLGCLVVFFAYTLMQIGLLARNKNLAVSLPVLAFCTSTVLYFLANIPGYFDFLGCFFLLMVVHAPSLRMKMVLAVLLFSVSLLIHEVIVILFLPLAFVIIILSMNDDGRDKHLVICISGVFIAMLATALFIANGAVDSELVSKISDMAQKKTSTIIEPSVFEIFDRDLSDNTQLASNVRIIFFGHSTTGFIWYISYLPALVLLAIANFKMLYSQQKNPYISMALVVLPVSPLFLYPIAYDWIRWISWATFNSFVLYGLLCRMGFAKSLYKHAIWYFLSIAVCVYGQVHQSPLLNGKMERFPYPAHQAYIKSVISGGKLIPEQRPMF